MRWNSWGEARRPRRRRRRWRRRRRGRGRGRRRRGGRRGPWRRGRRRRGRRRRGRRREWPRRGKGRAGRRRGWTKVLPQVVERLRRCRRRARRAGRWRRRRVHQCRAVQKAEPDRGGDPSVVRMHAQALLRTHRKDEVGGPCVGLDGHIGVEPIDLCLNKRLREGQHGLSPAIGRSAVHTKRCALKRLPRHVARDHTGNGARVEVVQQDTAGGAANDSLRAHHRARRACKANAEPVACGAGERAHKGGVEVRSVDSVVEREARHWRHRACIASAVTRDSKRLAAGGRRLGRQGRRRRLREWRGDLRRWQTRRRRRR